MKEAADTKILLIDDEKDILEFLSYNLTNAGYDVKTASDPQKGIKVAKQFIPQIIILDIMMPEMDGIEVCTILREEKYLDDSLIVFLTARNESFTQISALESGGDDFINKPIKLNILKSKIAALARRLSRGSNLVDKEVTYGDLSINFEEFKVSLDGKEVNLAKKEFNLLKLLVSRPGKVFERAEILNKVWGSEVIVGDRTIDVHIRKLREKIGKGHIKTMKGVGYRFKY
ncbi:MAG: two-component system alkaline phosphatase synthesis response regulator PhoP [Saprospiraceae bacterium]|jgi:two-component system alkaline phosphatase synthesis response regulator PhoP